MTQLEHIVVVGASLGGLRAVQALRRQGYAGKLTLVGEEPHRPYDRPPLSKEVLRGEEHKVKLDLSPPSFDKLAVDLVLGRRAMELDAARRRIRLDDGRDLAYDGLVIATGAYPRLLPNQPDLDGVFVLRTIDDARALQAALVAAKNVVVVGAGFIGAEVAASCREIGKNVTMLEALPVPVARALGLTIGEALAALHRKQGVDVRCGVGVRAIEGDGERVREILLDDGTRLPADVVVVGIGVVPAIDWLRSSGITLGDGVICDERCATSLPDVVALGDVASWQNPLFGERMRVEHWTNAVEQAQAAAARLVKGPECEPYAHVPMFWSDQFGIKIQGAGRPRPDDTIHVCHGSIEEGRFTALFGRDGRLVGCVTFHQPPKLIQYRKMIGARASWDEAMAAANG